jgi:hypothetical protein
MSMVFISYRRGDSAGHTGRLFDSLEVRFGRDAFFRDLESLEAGIDFPAELNKALAGCRVMLVMIGPGWIGAQAGGVRRLDQPDDLVRIEVATALERKDVRTIPVLVGGATMPSSQELPESLKPLATRNSIEISDSRWDYDLGRLASALVKVAGLQDREAAGSTAPASDVKNEKRASSLGKRGLIALGGAMAALVLYAIAQGDEEPTVEEATADAPPAAALGDLSIDGLTWTATTGGVNRDWNEAVAHCAGLGMRLPDLSELGSIDDVSNPSASKLKIKQPFHEGVGSNWIWTSDEDVDDPTKRFIYDFEDLHGKTLPIDFKDGAQALCVRSN